MVTLIEAEAHLMNLDRLFLHFVWQFIVVWVIFAKLVKLLRLVRLQIEHVAELGPWSNRTAYHFCPIFQARPERERRSRKVIIDMLKLFLSGQVE